MFTDINGNQYKKVAENETTLFLVPLKKLYDGGLEYNYENIKAIDKREPEYPLEKVISYVGGDEKRIERGYLGTVNV